MDLNYKTTSIFPDSQKEFYGDGVENINFSMLIPQGRAYVPNTLRITGKVNFYADNNTEFTSGDQVFFDNRIGMHSLFRSIYTSDNGGNTSTIDEYPTWAKHVMLRTKDQQDYAGSATLDLALCTVSHVQTFEYIEQGSTFCIYPQIGLNMMDPSGGGLTNRRGVQNITLTTNNTLSILFGTIDNDGKQALTSTAEYKITNLKLHYDTRPIMPMDNEASMVVVWHARHTASTNSDVFNTNLPMVANGMVASYKPVQVVNNAVINEYVMTNPGIQRLEFTYNNSTNELLTYAFKTDEEIILNSLNALEFSEGKTPSTVYQLSSQNATEFTIGLNFGESLDMTKARFSVRSETADINNQERYFLDLFCVGSMTL
jgi:hypothetical protein